MHHTTQPQSFWRSLEEQAEPAAFLQRLQGEFPPLAADTFRSNRRDFLKLLGAMLAMTSLSACNSAAETNEKIVPYVNPPENLVQGKALFFATAMPLGGYGKGALVESFMGRPIKIEGNPQHPASLGATDPYMQGSIFGLYNPERAQTVTNQGAINTWEAFLEMLNAKLTALEANGGAGLHLLTETITSPTLGAQIAALRQRFPTFVWHQYEPIGLDNVRAGAQLAFGRVVNPIYHFDQAEIILALDADFLLHGPGSLPYARAFSDRRRLWRSDPAAAGAGAAMNRLYVVESTPTITGAKADHRLAMQAGRIEAFGRAVAQGLGLAVESGGITWTAQEQRWLEALIADLDSQRGAALVVVGEEQPPLLHLLGHVLNDALGNVGTTVTYTEPVEVEPVIQLDSLRTLVEAMSAGQVDTLLILEANPVYTAPADFNFAEHLSKVNLAIHHSQIYDETSRLCHWHIPSPHFLEAWGDVRAFDGTATILQPLIMPLFPSRTAHEVLAALQGEPTRPAFEIVRSTWETYFTNQAQPAQPDAETFWLTAVHDGVVAGSAAPAAAVTLAGQWPMALSQPLPPAPAGLELIFRPDPSILDGRFAHNAWLQELPRPLTTLTWDNAALISPATAAQLGVMTEDQVELRFQGRTVVAGVWVLPGHADNAVTLNLGFGRTAGGTVSAGVGCNAYQLRLSSAPYFGSGLEVQKLAGRYPLAVTQEHFSMEGRELVRASTLEGYRAEPHFAQGEQVADHGTGIGEAEITAPSLYPEYEYNGYAWGMVIDLGACIGCNACTIACQVENNGPVVGKEGVRNSREMHWLKIDRYYEGDLNSPTAYFQPRLCMHCEKAPCEPVCPVEATLHNDEGLNQMVYNRCVGTRYCSNNCPYKVRRYNFFNYNEEIPLTAMQHNPDVTVRARGVMEKCTYCTQRIESARLEAAIQGRPIAEGELLTACQAACPTRAIIFGDINNPESAVAQAKAHALNYGLLTELGTQPRTTYLAEVRNPSPALI